jgi:hypothetical protein
MVDKPLRPNFFIVLGLDPAVPWDEPAFVRALGQKKAQWSRQTSGIKTQPATIEAKRNLSLVAEIERIMRDPELRKAEHSAARTEQADDLLRRGNEFRVRLDIMLEKEFLYDVERDELRKESDVLTRDPDLRRRVERAQTRPLRQARADGERLDASTQLILRRNLGVLGEPNLYRVLRRVDESITRASPRDRLLTAAEALYRKASHTMNKTPEVGATQELAGIATKVFGSDDSRRKHDFSMLLEPIDALIARYEATLATVRTVDGSQLERFLREAAEKGIDPSLARAEFVAYFEDRKWVIQLPRPEVEAELKRQIACPRCELLNDPESKFCTNCGSELRCPCPSCGRIVPAADGACGSCGFEIGQRHWVKYQAGKAEEAMARQDLGDAAAQLRKAELIWRLPPDSDDELAVRLRDVREQLDTLRGEQRETAAEIAALMAGGNYATVLQKLAAVPASFPDRDQLRSDAGARVREADELCWEARRAGISSGQRAELYARALRICADHRDARLGLARIPPAPPHGLRVIPDEANGFVRLAWQPSSESGVGYVVVRAIGTSPPVSAADAAGQQRVAGIFEPRWDDRDPDIGALVRYAVYAERAGTASETAAIAAEPVFLTANPQFTVRPGDGRVELAWTLPKRATDIEIRREEISAAPGPGPIALSYSEPGRLTDSDVRNGVRYRYSARAVFPDPAREGQLRHSRGVSREATPSPRPTGPGNLQVKGQPPKPGLAFYKHRVELRWAAPERGAITVVRSAGQPSLMQGDEFPADDLERHHTVPGNSPPVHDHWIEDLRTCHYFPVLVLDGRCHVGIPRRYAATEVTGLTAEYTAAAVQLRWTWPDGCDEVLIMWDEDRAPPDPASADRQARVTRSEYDQAGGYDLPLPATACLFVLVAAVVRTSDGEFISSGTSVSARAATSPPAAGRPARPRPWLRRPT